ncbi:hypothetical protein [Planctomycetes bacterium K23_9]|uniref:Knr4/Smi1-like domain-containing protein n=1 Tax=Stieleria marina TaxID=1930275 RepID=A0A517NTS8_9BACT|nr:hypothetical protein K239x_24690 [Planctomycetes bacterium K23_9]
MDIECTLDSDLIFDQRIVDAVQSPEGCCNISHILDPVFARQLPRIAGKTPALPYFTANDGRCFRIGWFVGYADESTELAGPLQPGINCGKLDGRITEQSLPEIINLTALDLFGGGDRLLPFAALCDDGPPISLRWQNYDFPVNDSLCFDTSTDPHTIVVCDALKAADAANEWEDGVVGDIRYDTFIAPVAKAFADFATMLRAHP